MPLLIRKIIDANGVEWIVRRLVRESARLNGGDRRVSVLRCYAAGRKVEVLVDGEWEEFSDADLLGLIARSRAIEPRE